MIEYSLWEKITTVFRLVIESPLFLILFFGVILMVIDVLYISKANKKTKNIYIVICLAVVSLLIYSYIDSVTDIVDAVAINFVQLIYFPSILEYMITLSIGLIILFISMFSKKMKTSLKRVNLFVFIINAFLFFLIIDQISRHEVDLSDRVSIYVNTYLMVLLELSLIIFIVWIVGLILYKIISILNSRRNKADNDGVNLDTRNFYSEPVLPENINELRQEALMAAPRVEYIYVEKERDEEMFTLEEYKLMKEYLDEMKERNSNKKK